MTNDFPARGVVATTLRGFISAVEGMAVTLSWMFRRPYTIQWPDKIEKPLEETLPERYRGILEVDVRICIGCGACKNACPIDCIAVTLERDPETKDRSLTDFSINASKCMYCGLCVEACPTGALRHTRLFAASNSRVENLVLRYVALGEKVTPYKPKDPRPDAIPSGRLAQARLKPCFPEERKNP